MDPWVTPPAERARHMEQFRSLNPVGGFVTGDQAKGFLLQSQLPPPVLGQIWSLADANCDGKMDINEFSVACKLITMKLKGFEVPPTLPPSLRMVLAGTGQTTPVLTPSSSQQMLASQPQPMVQPVMMMPGQVPNSMMGMGIPASMNVGVIAQSTGITSPPLVMPGQPVAYSGPNAVAMGVPMPGMVPVMPAMPPTSLPLGYVQSVQQPVMRTSQSQSSVQQLSRSASITSQDAVAVSSPLMEWAVPNPSRLKYTQMFNQNDRSKSGYLSGVQARNILMATGLPQQILATVWALSDLDSDGRLSCEEFILSMHLCDVAKQTGRLPPKLPADLIPPSYRSGSRRMSMKSASMAGSIAASGHNTGSNTPTFDEPLLSPGGTSFEDKRKQNYDKGQAELDRRRKLLEDMANREREERERKEREEFEKREKQRLEIERRKQEEIERQLAVQREMEERRLEELRKSEEQKESARKEMERQRQAEMEETKRNELLARRQKEQDEVLRLKGVNNGLGLEVSQLTDKVKELSNKITETRKGVSTVKSEIDGMRTKRDTFMNDMAMLKAQLKDQNNRMLHAAQEKVRLEKLASESDVKHINLKQLREKQQNVKEEFEKKQADSNAAKSELNELRSSLSTLVESCKTIYEQYRDKRDQLQVLRKKHLAEFSYNAAWAAASPREPEAEPFRGPPESTVVYYRALFDFESRNPDELSFTAGAIIEKNEDVPDPGWLSGTLDGRSGWFPESFVEVLSDHIPDTTTAVTSPPAVANNYGAEAGGEYYVALYPYESHEPDDLPFEAGESIFVTHSEGEWWTGSVGDRSGIFPANYVAKHSELTAEIEQEAKTVQQEVNNYTTNAMTAFERSFAHEPRELEPEEEADLKREISGFTKQPPPKSPKATGKSKKYEIATVLSNYAGNTEGQLTLTKGQLITVRKKNSSGWWEGELQAKGKKREIGWFPGSYVKILGPGGGSRQSSSRTTPIPFDEVEMPVTVAPIYAETKEQMIALYPYTAQNSDELTFVKDDVIVILSKDEPDWWRGQLGSEIGLFPVNYVQPLSSQPADNQ